MDAALIGELDKYARKIRRLTDDVRTELKRGNVEKATKLVGEIDGLGRKLRKLAETMAAYSA